MRVRRWLAPIAALLGTTVLIGACGGDDDSGSSGTGGTKLSEPTEATLILDFVPNAVHAGIYRAVAAGYYEETTWISISGCRDRPPTR